jgi:hypothetical protein
VVVPSSFVRSLVCAECFIYTEKRYPALDGPHTYLNHKNFKICFLWIWVRVTIDDFILVPSLYMLSIIYCSRIFYGFFYFQSYFSPRFIGDF